MRLFLTSLLVSAALAPSAVRAADVGTTFDGTYARSEAACRADPDAGEMDDSLRVDSAGISGYELYCQFAGLQLLTDDGTIKDFVTLAACGDDSGITRPDSFWIAVYDDGRMTVQSQSEYIGGDDDFLSGDYVLCH